MDAKLKAKWVKALLSGKYRQADGLLFTGTGYCCLGVLGSVTGIPDASLSERTFLRTRGGYDFVDAKIQGALAELNDDGVPFEMIAGLIDEAL